MQAQTALAEEQLAHSGARGFANPDLALLVLHASLGADPLQACHHKVQALSGLFRRRTWSRSCRMAAARADTGSSPADDGAERPSDRRLISVSASSSGVQLASHATATSTLSCPAGLRREQCTLQNW